MKPEYQRYFAELIGTFVLVFAGAGAVMANAYTNGAVGVLGIAFAHGFALMAMVYALGSISGTHINPAVTIAFLFARKIKLETAIGYVLFQLAGSVLAALALLSVFPHAQQFDAGFGANLGLTTLSDSLGVTTTIGTLIELVLTFFLVFTIFSVAVDKKNSTPLIGLAIGMVLTLSIIIGGPFTGAALNPARWFGPALATQHLENAIVYTLGPILGGLAAALVYTTLFMQGEKRTVNKKS